MKISGIYTITCIINNKYYVGYSKNIHRRFSIHKSYLKSNKHDNQFLQNAWNKYGEKNFVFEILEECEEEYLNSLEHYWCYWLNSHNDEYGYNIQPTSHDGAIKFSTFTKNKMSKIRNNKKGLYKKETKEKISIAHSKPVLQYDIDGNFIREWKSSTDAEKTLNISSGSISSVCRGRREFIKGYSWRFKLNNEIPLKINLPPLKNKKCVLQLTKENKLINRFSSIKEASLKTSIHSQSINKCCKKGYPLAGGFIWKYDEEEIKNKKQFKRIYKPIKLKGK